jgi:hypothetical protein
MSLNTSHKQYTTDETKLLQQLVIVLRCKEIREPTALALAD